MALAELVNSRPLSGGKESGKSEIIQLGQPGGKKKMKARYILHRAMGTAGEKGMARLGLVVALLLAGSLVAAPSAQALVFNLTSDHCTGGCGTPPFGTVTLTQNGTTVDVTVHLYSPNKFVQTGAGDDQAFKFNGDGVVLGDITVDAHTPTLVAAEPPPGESFDGDGGGDFAFGINCPTCGTGGSNAFYGGDIVFHVANATIADLTGLNDKDQVFVADILGATGNTGLVDATSPQEPQTEIPEPGTMLLLGSGLTGLVLSRRLRSRAKR